MALYHKSARLFNQCKGLEKIEVLLCDTIIYLNKLYFYYFKTSLFCVVESEVASVARRSRHLHTFNYNRLTLIISFGM